MIGPGSDKNNEEFFENGNELGLAMNKDEKMRMMMNQDGDE